MRGGDVFSGGRFGYSSAFAAAVAAATSSGEDGTPAAAVAPSAVGAVRAPSKRLTLRHCAGVGGAAEARRAGEVPLGA